MASSNEYLKYVSEDLLGGLDISHKKMMGEFLLYLDGTLFGGIYDDRFLIKQTPFGKAAGLKEETPYDGAKPMLAVDIDDSEKAKTLVLKTVEYLRKN